MPFKNTEKWIAETIRSVQDQSVTDWELLCIDDHSTDGSASVVRSFANEDSRIQLLQNTDKGIISALLTGLHASQGLMITRMDADDLMPLDRLEKHLHVMNHSLGRVVVTGKVEYFSDSEVSEGYRKYERWLNARVDLDDYYDHIYRECVVASPNWMVHKEHLIEDRIFESLRYPEDYDMTFHWMKNGYTIISSPSITLQWREHPERTSRNSDIYQQESFFRLKLDWFCQLHKVDEQSVGILGAGTKGKLTASILSEKDISFNWHDLNAEKYGSPIYGKTIQSSNELNTDLLLIAVYPDPINPLMEFLAGRGYNIGENAWFL